MPPRPLILAGRSTAHPGGGQAVTFTPGSSVSWRVRRIVVQSTVAGPAYVYVGEPMAENLVSGTRTGEFDENDANQPYLVPESSRLVIVWPSGGACVARIEFDEVPLFGGAG